MAKFTTAANELVFWMDEFELASARSLSNSSIVKENL